jgi:hypothetical protein
MLQVGYKDVTGYARGDCSPKIACERQGESGTGLKSLHITWHSWRIDSQRSYTKFEHLELEPVQV